ncbi:MAG: hypothetical protein RLZZ241_2347 [Bacteroidota bacterium]|jgi:alanine racemase
MIPEMLPNRNTFLQINLGALAHNYSFLRSRLNPETKLLCVVKAFAYGSEAVAIAKKLEDLGADYLAVAFVDEGITLRKAGIRLPILVFHPQLSGLDALMRYQLEPSLYNRSVFNAFLERTRALNDTSIPVHIKFNTGLNRLGFGMQDLDWLIQTVKSHPKLRLASVYSHLAASDDLNERDFTQKQIQSFRTILESFLPELPVKPLIHLLNTSGILNFPEAQFNMVRTGIGLHGFSNNPEIDSLLRPVSCLLTRISQLHHIAPGQWVGYNKGFVAQKEMVTATLPLGHADGIGRIFGHGNAQFLIRGQMAPTVGNICMDMTMIDVSHLDCKEGDRVEFFGFQHKASEQAENAGTISYELITGISQRVARQILDS